MAKDPKPHWTDKFRGGRQTDGDPNTIRPPAPDPICPVTDTTSCPTDPDACRGCTDC
jgi:hypothetical protein